MDDNLCAGVEPAHIIRGRAHDFDMGIGIAHGADALARVSLNIQIDRIVAAAPEPAANSVLSQGINHQGSFSLADSRLNALLQYTGSNPLAVMLT
jgi:hypothetical protein